MLVSLRRPARGRAGGGPPRVGDRAPPRAAPGRRPGPRRPALGTAGPVFIYTGFERRILREAAARAPDLAPQLEAIVARTFDLCELAKLHYYHPAMKGSWSIKAVLPTIAPELDYANLVDVSDGGGAQAAYLEIIAPDTPLSRKAHLIGALRRYREHDTLGMVRMAGCYASAGSGSRF